jgi:hypothetical protein
VVLLKLVAAAGGLAVARGGFGGSCAEVGGGIDGWGCASWACAAAEPRALVAADADFLTAGVGRVLDACGCSCCVGGGGGIAAAAVALWCAGRERGAAVFSGTVRASGTSPSSSSSSARARG